MDPDRTQNITKSFERGKSPLLIGKRFRQYYRSSRCQDRFIVEDYDEFLEYLKKEVLAGDIIDVYDLSDSWSSKGEPSFLENAGMNEARYHRKSILDVGYWPCCDGHPGAELRSAMEAKTASRAWCVIISATDPLIANITKMFLVWPVNRNFRTEITA